MEQVAPGVYRAGTLYVNWYVIDAGTEGLTLIDAGFPKYASLHPADTALAAEPKTNRPERALPYTLWPATVAFIGHAIRAGALSPHPMPATVPLTDGTAAEVPGRPFVTHVPGHTAGSCVLEFREHGVLFAGDLLCTISPLLGRKDQPQLQSRGSNRDSGEAMRGRRRERTPHRLPLNTRAPARAAGMGRVSIRGGAVRRSADRDYPVHEAETRPPCPTTPRPGRSSTPSAPASPTRSRR